MSAIDDLATLISDEARVHHSHYQQFAKRAEEMGCNAAAKFFRAMVAAEKARVNLYLDHLADLDSAETCDYYVCPQCGVALTVAPPAECPLCHTPGTRFERIV